MRTLVTVAMVCACGCVREEPRRVPVAAVVMAPVKPTRVETAAVDGRIEARKAAHDALAEHCGACHEQHRSKTPRALAIFDLDQPDWPGSFDAHRFEAALGRLADKPAARAAFVAFRDAELASRGTP